MKDVAFNIYDPVMWNFFFRRKLYFSSLNLKKVGNLYGLATYLKMFFSSLHLKYCQNPFCDFIVLDLDMHTIKPDPHHH